MERARSSEERKINIAQICIYLQNFKVEEGFFFFFFPHAAPLRFESNTDSLRDVLDYINPSRDPRNLVDSPLRLNAPEPANFASLRRPAAPVHPSDAQMGFSELKGDTKSGGKKSGTFLVLHIICD